MKNISSLQSKTFYKVKKPKREFLCALCSAPRQMKYSKNLAIINYLQISILAATVIWLLAPVMGLKAGFMLFPVWLMFELTNKLLYRKELSCPYCGFDPSWYRRDVNIANKVVKKFWIDNYPELVNRRDAAILADIPEELGVVEPASTDAHLDKNTDAYRQ